MIFENSFVVAASPDAAWKIILDVPAIAPCLPGATLTEQVDDSTFKGNVSVKLGPVALTFRGTAAISDRDETQRTAVVRANGSDSKGRGQAKAETRFKLVPDPKGTRVEIVTDLSLTGAVAQYGRGATLIQGVAGALIAQFEARLNARLAESASPDNPNVAASAGSGVATPSPGPAPSNAIGIGLLWQLLLRGVRNAFSRRT